MPETATDIRTDPSSSVSKSISADRFNGRWSKRISPTKFLVESGVEEALMANIAARGQNAGKIFFGVTCKGDVNDMNFERAAETALIKHPILGCRFEKRGLWGGLTLVEDAGLKIPVVRIREEMPWEQAYVEYSQPVPYVPTQSPNLTIFVLARPSTENSKFSLFIEIQHWCADGTSISCLLHDLLLWASKKVDDNGRMAARGGPYPRPMSLALRNASSSTATSLWRKACAMAFLAPLFFKSWTTFPLIQSPPEDAKFRTMALCGSFSKEESAGLLKLCHSRGTTLTCATAIAFCFGVSKVLDRPKKDRLLLYIASDIRPVCKVADHDLSIHVTMTPMMVPSLEWTTDADSAWNHAKDLKLELHQTISKHLHGLGLVTSFGMSIPDTLQLKPTFMVTSWGAKSPIQPTYGSASLEEAHLRMATHHLYYPTLSVFSVAGRINICWKAGEDKVERLLFEQAFAEGMRVMRAMLAND